MVCTHAILPPATPTIERLGLAPLLVDHGVPRTGAEFWTPYGGWFGLPDDATLAVEDLMRDTRFTWSGKIQRIRLDPADLPFSIWRLGRREGF